MNHHEHERDSARLDTELRLLSQESWSPSGLAASRWRRLGEGVHARLRRQRSLKQALLAITLIPVLSLAAYGGHAFVQDFVVGIRVRDHQGREYGGVPARVKLDDKGRVAPIGFTVQERIGQSQVTVMLEGEGHTEESVRARIDQLNEMPGGLVRLDHPADLVAPAGNFTRQDIAEFLAMFELRIPTTDLAEPKGVWDRHDVLAYLDLFAAGRAAALEARAEGDSSQPHWPDSERGR